MRKVRAIVAAFISICGLLLGSIEVTAAGVQGMEILADHTAVRKGQEITFTFALNGYEDIRDGLNALKGTLGWSEKVWDFDSLKAGGLPVKGCRVKDVDTALSYAQRKREKRTGSLLLPVLDSVSF